MALTQNEITLLRAKKAEQFEAQKAKAAEDLKTNTTAFDWKQANTRYEEPATPAAPQ
jgi:hypothetical protein